MCIMIQTSPSQDSSNDAEVSQNRDAGDPGDPGDPTDRMRSFVAVVDSMFYYIFDVVYIFYYYIINYPLALTIH